MGTGDAMEGGKLASPGAGSLVEREGMCESRERENSSGPKPWEQAQ